MDAFRLVSSIRSDRPLIHCIANIVTVNDCANLLLAVGASPIMANCAAETAEITARSSALVLNAGTPDEAKFSAFLSAGAAANANGIPVVLDPVGAGASSWRLKNIISVLEKVHPAIIRANSGEAAALLSLGMDEHGVDSLSDAHDAQGLAAALARKYMCTVLLTGDEDIISDGGRTVSVSGGSALMKQITGAGCMLSCLCGAFAAVAEPFDAARAASTLWKYCAATAEQSSRGLGSFHAALFDVVSAL